MGARQSPEMAKAKKLVLGGMSQYEAAAKSGITAGAISKAPWYREHKAELAAAAKTKRARK